MRLTRRHALSLAGAAARNSTYRELQTQPKKKQSIFTGFYMFRKPSNI